MKKNISAIIILFLFIISSIKVSAHSLNEWANYYQASNANATYSFGFFNSKHINGKNVKYYFQTTTAENYYGTAAANAFTDIWQGLITGTKVSSSANANVKISYSSTAHPEGYSAITTIYFVNSGTDYHYGTGTNGTEMIIYYPTQDYTAEDKKKLLAHEFGHLWGLADLYPFNNSLSSIYSNTYAFSAATRHDRNAMRICLENYWFNPGNSQVWKYQSSPGVFTLRGDPDQNGSITTDDSRLVMRYAIGLEIPTSLQIKVSDVDGNGVTTSDSRLILRYAIGLETRFPLDLDE